MAGDFGRGHRRNPAGRQVADADASGNRARGSWLKAAADYANVRWHFSGAAVRGVAEADERWLSSIVFRRALESEEADDRERK